MNADALFDDWLASRAGDSRDPLDAQNAESYRYIWKRWRRFLAEHAPGSDKPRARTYLLATPALVAEFLESGRSLQREHGQASDRLSETARRRYWTTLRRLYAHAIAHGLLGLNPAEGLPAAARPLPEHTEALVIARPVWEVLPAHLPVMPGWLMTRNRAMLALLMELALTPGELLGLRLAQISGATDQPGGLRVQLTGTRAAQARELVLGASGAALLQAWLDERTRLVAIHRRRIAAAHADCVFLSERFGPTSRNSLFKLISQTLLQAHRAAGMTEPAKHSPMVLRNTRLYMRLVAGEDPALIWKEAGMKDAASFRGLMPRLTGSEREAVIESLAQD